MRENWKSNLLIAAGSIAVVAAVVISFRPKSSPEMDFESNGHSLFRIPADTVTPADRSSVLIDPQRDKWVGEALNGAIGEQLSKLKKYVESYAAAPHDSYVLEFVAAAFEADLTRIGKSRLIGSPGFVVGGQSEPASAGLLDLPNLIAWILGPDDIVSCRISLKVVGIEAVDKTATADVLVEILVEGDRAIRQINSVWKCQWIVSDKEAPKLKRLAVTDLETVSQTSKQALFRDVSVAAFANAANYISQQHRGIESWSDRITRIDDMLMTGHHGVAVSDVNGDGLEDVYVCEAGGLPNRLYLQQADGTVVDYSKESGTDWKESTNSALLVDLDNDGDQDLVLCSVAGVIFAENDGKAHFQIRHGIPNTREATSICAADIDNDRDLDIYVCMYGAGGNGRKRGFEAAFPLPYNDANNGGRNLLLLNQGRFHFDEATSSFGLDENNRRWSFSAAWHDYDLDGDSDLYVANDFGRNCLYRNDGGKFRDVADEVGVQDMAAGMSVAWGDMNRDGRGDIYIGNMYSAAGNRVTYQRRFLEGRRGGDVQGIQRMARGNSLFVSKQDGNFADVSESCGVTMGRWAWASVPIDINNDGWRDLVVANGYLTNDKTDDL